MVIIISTEQNKCHPNPCRNGGTCTGINEGEGFECTCKEGYKGKSCEGNFYFFRFEKVGKPHHRKELQRNFYWDDQTSGYQKLKMKNIINSIRKVLPNVFIFQE